MKVYLDTGMKMLKARPSIFNKSGRKSSQLCMTREQFQKIKPEIELRTNKASNEKVKSQRNSFLDDDHASPEWCMC